MKKNYIYLIVLLLVTISLTLLLSNLYKNKVFGNSYLYDKVNKITALEFSGYITENPDTIIYISEKVNSNYNKFEKQFYKKIESLNLMHNTIYLEKEEMTVNLQNYMSDKYSFKYSEESLPVIIVINDGKKFQVSRVDENSVVDTIINYEVFK